MPDARLTWLVNQSLEPLFQLCPDIDSTIPFNRRGCASLSGIPELARFCRRLHQQKFDWVLDFQGLFRSGFFSRLISTRQRYGFAAAREGAPWFYTHPIKTAPHLHAVERNLALLSAVLQEPVPYTPPLFKIPQTIERAAQKLLTEHQVGDFPFIAITPGSRWAAKTWAPEFFAAALTAARDRLPTETRFCVLGGANEQKAGEVIRAALPPGTVCNLAGKTDLSLLLALLYRSRALLTNDSGPMHIAAAMARPVVALFCPTNPELTGPYGTPHIILRTACPQTPCMQRICPLGMPPPGHSNGLTPEDAGKALAALLERHNTD